MNKIDIINMLNKEMNVAERITDKQLDTLALDVTRVLDSKITEIVNEIKNDSGDNINSVKKELIRLAFLGYPIKLEEDLDSYKPTITEEEKQKAYELLIEGFIRNEEVMTKSLVARYKKHFSNAIHLSDRYVDYIKEKQKGQEQLIIIKINAKDKLSTNDIINMIKQKYDELSNYHHLILIFEDDSEHIISWKMIAEVSVYMENFRKEYRFSAFNRSKNKRITETKGFLRNHSLIDYGSTIDTAVEQFYEAVAYGFQFQDLFVTSDGMTKILVMQKVELDEEPEPCPSCFQKIVRGNSYPKLLYKSFECTNPECPSRSKIGRGKRYDFFSCKRQSMLERDCSEDYISESISEMYRRDIITNFDEERITDLISLYCWAGDSVLLINVDLDIGKEYLKRTIRYEELDVDASETYSIEELPILNLYKEIYKHITYDGVALNENLEYESINHDFVIKGNSSELVPFISRYFSISEIGGAVTSPPYFNAREYSQWPNLVTYFVDMMINANAVHQALKENGTYIYNIGDVVGQDNVYINSNMSKRRQMLGFYTIVIFHLVGYSIKTNIIWDKGEVQSKRNSSANRFPGYLKPINAYEHDFVFVKDAKNDEITHTQVRKIDAVKKINSKGENKLGHTAPYPIEIAELIIPYSENNDDYILDPFLGSGTTIIAANKNMRKAIGFELNEQYYHLSINRIKDNRMKQKQLTLF